MKFTSKHLSGSLKGLLNFFWYTGITFSAVTFIAAALFLFASYGDLDLNIPSVSFRAGNFNYRFNTKYLEVIHTEDIIRQYKQLEMGKLLTTDTWEKKCYESLYNIKFPPPDKHPGIKIDRYVPGYFIFDNNIPWNHSGIFELKNIPFFPISISIMIIAFVFLGMIILFNVRKIMSVDSAEDLFSANCSRYIKYIGLYILLSEFVRLLFQYWINSSIAGKFFFSELWGSKVTTMNGNYFVSWSDVNYWLVFIGLITLLISEVLRTGASLKEDVDLTI